MESNPYENPVKEFLTVSLDRCMQEVNAGSGSIFLVDEVTQDLVLEIIHSKERRNLEGTRTKLGERVSGRVAQERKPFLVANIDSEPSFGTFPRYSHYQSKSFLSVPLESSGTLLGVVNLTEKGDGTVFDNDDLDAVMLIARQLGIALEKLKLFSASQKTEYLRLKAERENLSRSIEQYKKFSSLGKFIGGLVHEINNPLDGVMRYINLSMDRVQSDEVLKEYLQESQKGLQRIAQFVRSLLDFSWSMSSAGREIDVNRIFEETRFLYDGELRSGNVSVETELDSNLPKIPDYGLKIVLNNLFKNAREAMQPEGGVIRAKTRKIPGGIMVEFSDTGAGIPAEVKGRIFEPFFTTKQMGEGSGLGLALVSEIVEKYKGTIHVDSGRGAGTTFRIFLPASNFQTT
ncbi:MAG: GAF domain-containing protein [Candidatus Omnitrophica bacterium]|nr:GAF domain-containing protein [Candidatus Omnitrophota bacterium]